MEFLIPLAMIYLLAVLGIRLAESRHRVLGWAGFILVIAAFLVAVIWLLVVFISQSGPTRSRQLPAWYNPGEMRSGSRSGRGMYNFTREDIDLEAIRARVAREAGKKHDYGKRGFTHRGIHLSGARGRRDPRAAGQPSGARPGAVASGRTGAPPG